MKSVVLAKQLRDARKELGLTQKELGKDIGVSRQVITQSNPIRRMSRWERCKKIDFALDCDFTIELKQKKRSKRMA